MRRLALVIGLTALASGCGGSSTTTVTAVAPPPTTTSGTFTLHPSSTATRCTDYLYQHAARITFYSHSFDVSSACRSWVVVNARQGQYWVQTSKAPSSRSRLSTVCTLEIRQGRVIAVVVDSRDEVFGQAACTGLISAGWVEQGAPSRQEPLRVGPPLQQASN